MVVAWAQLEDDMIPVTAPHTSSDACRLDA